MSDIVIDTSIGNSVQTPIAPIIKTFEQRFAELETDKTLEHSMEVLAAKLLPNCVEIELDSKTKKCISYSDFRDIIGKSINNTSDIQVEGLLPPSGTIFLSQTVNQMRINCYYTGGVRKLLYSRGNMDIVVPNIIISHTLKKDAKDWIITATNYFCTDLPVSKLPRTFISSISHKDHIFLLPMSNTYEGGNMCYGSNTMPVRFRDNNLRGLDYYYSYLWSTPFNDDLGIYAVGRGMSPSEWYSKLREHAKKGEPFPYKALSGWNKDETPYSAGTAAQ